LGKLVSSLGIEIKNRHRADGDAKATLKLFKKICLNLNKKQLSKFIKINQ
jgi:DNA polymerase-3 subunit epsilon